MTTENYKKFTIKWIADAMENPGQEILLSDYEDSDCKMPGASAAPMLMGVIDLLDIKGFHVEGLGQNYAWLRYDGDSAPNNWNFDLDS